MAKRRIGEVGRGIPKEPDHGFFYPHCGKPGTHCTNITQTVVTLITKLMAVRISSPPFSAQHQRSLRLGRAYVTKDKPRMRHARCPYVVQFHQMAPIRHGEYKTQITHTSSYTAAHLGYPKDVPGFWFPQIPNRCTRG
jgi:hypothetical protein